VKKIKIKIKIKIVEIGSNKGVPSYWGGLSGIISVQSSMNTTDG
jgi:hypothetical protein